MTSFRPWNSPCEVSSTMLGGEAIGKSLFIRLIERLLACGPALFQLVDARLGCSSLVRENTNVILQIDGESQSGDHIGAEHPVHSLLAGAFQGREVYCQQCEIVQSSLPQGEIVKHDFAS